MEISAHIEFPVTFYDAISFCSIATIRNASQLWNFKTRTTIKFCSQNTFHRKSHSHYLSHIWAFKNAEWHTNGTETLQPEWRIHCVIFTLIANCKVITFNSSTLCHFFRFNNYWNKVASSKYLARRLTTCVANDLCSLATEPSTLGIWRI